MVHLATDSDKYIQTLGKSQKDFETNGCQG